MGDRDGKAALFDGLVSAAKALSSGRRAEIVDILAQGERPVEEIATEIGQSVANTSQHLQNLLRAGLVRTRRDGNRIYYALADVDVIAYCRGPYCVYADDAVRLLTASGRRAARLEDGYPEWARAGLPVTSPTR